MLAPSTMLGRLAEMSTVHGIKEAYNASRLGRIFWAATFAVIFGVMTTQLDSMFVKYMNRVSGMSITPIPSSWSEYMDVPSIYYCSPMWFPSIDATKKVVDINDPVPSPNPSHNSYVRGPMENMFKYCSQADHFYYVNRSTAIHTALNISVEDCEPYRQYWRAAMIEDLVTDIVMPRDIEKRRFSFRNGGKTRRHIEYDYDDRDMLAELIAEIKQEHGGSLQKYVENITHVSTKDKAIPANSIHIETSDDQIEDFFEYLKGDSAAGFNEDVPLASYRDLLTPPDRYQWLFESHGTPAVNLNGVCWETQRGRASQSAANAMGGLERHVIVHFGGYGYRLRAVAQVNGAVSAMNFYKYFDGPGPTSSSYPTQAATFASIAMQSSADLYFKDRIRLDEFHPFASVRYWTKKVSRLSTRTDPCRAGDWTHLDQAHCNQNKGLSENDPKFPCQRYLHASERFPETPLSNRLCISDHSNYFTDGVNASSPTSPAAGFNFSRIDSRGLEDVVAQLTKSSESCPRPCVVTNFDFDVTYTVYSFDSHEVIYTSTMFFKQPCMKNCDSSGEIYRPCFYALAALFRNTSDKGLISDLHNFAQTATQYGPIPCSIVDFQQTEWHGMAFEEFALYSLSDIASSLGGTLGLWMGASIVSAVQALYICCLERMFAAKSQVSPRPVE